MAERGGFLQSAIVIAFIFPSFQIKKSKMKSLFQSIPKDTITPYQISMSEQQFILHSTAEFKKWIKNLKNPIAKTHIAMRLDRAIYGNFGDHKPVGNGVYEMRINTGAGYRIYYAQKGEILYILLYGGDKSTQSTDIAKAKEIWTELTIGTKND